MCMYAVCTTGLNKFDSHSTQNETKTRQRFSGLNFNYQYQTLSDGICNQK